MFPIGSVCGTRTSLAALTAAGLLLGLAALVLTAGDGSAAATAKPSNTAEPDIDGRAEQGRTLSTSRGRWSGTGPISYEFRWVRCGANGGRPDGSTAASSSAPRAPGTRSPARTSARVFAPG